MCFVFLVSSKADLKRKKAKIGNAIAKFLEPSFAMFENREAAQTWIVDDYGVRNDDLVFRDIQSMESRW
jgi:hypothetical protein